MAKRLICGLLVCLMIISSILPVYAHEREEHDADIEYVLFGNRDYKDTHPVHKSTIQAIEDATYLAVDQFNGNGKKELENLQNEHIPGLPATIAEIDFTGNYAHRNYTHRGWNVNYDAKSHWEERQKILMNTVEKELFSSVSPPLDWFPWLQGIVYGENTYKKQCESFCILLYYVHIIGDHIEAGEEKTLGKGETREKTLEEKTTGLAYVAPLSNPNDRDNPGIIPDLITCFSTLFESQKGSYTYENFIQELEDLKTRSERIYTSTGGVNTEEKFDEYNACAIELLDVLAEYVPGMLKKEEFFSATFN